MQKKESNFLSSNFLKIIFFSLKLIYPNRSFLSWLVMLLILFNSIFGTMVSWSQSLTWLGSLGGADTWPWDISHNGSVVVGWSSRADGNGRAFKWTKTGGMQDLGALTGGNVSSAYGVSSDGSVIVGDSYTTLNLVHAFRWTSAGGMQSLGTFGGNYSRALDVSADGSVIVGWAYNAANNSRAFLWTETRGMQYIDTLRNITSAATGVSANGEVVCGYAFFNGVLARAFRWIATSGIQDLGSLGGESRAYAISADGSTIVGWSRNQNQQQRAFRWTSSTGMQDLGTLGGNYSEAFATSANGSIVVGSASDSTGRVYAFRWTETGGMENLNTKYANLLTNNSFLLKANAISHDGRYIVGVGYNGNIGIMGSHGFILDTETSTSIFELDNKILNTFTLYQNYPNPFNPKTTISFTLQESGLATLKIYNAFGEEVMTLINNEYLEAGEFHRIEFDGSGLASGMYITKLQSGNKVQKIKMMLVK